MFTAEWLINSYASCQEFPHLLQHYEEELYDDQLISIEQMLASFDFSEV